VNDQASLFDFKVTTAVDNTAMLKAAMATLRRRMVVVGYPEDKNVSRRGGGITNASLAYIQDKGSPARNIPPRPFLQPGVEAVELPVQKRLAQGARAALDGDEAGVDKSLNAAGLTAQAGVRSFITNGNFAPLKPSTIKGRQRKGFAGTKPLIVTGQLRNAVNYSLRNRRGGE
jgi:hypothetical protein